jgi:AcrR family transcriptional regulator
MDTKTKIFNVALRLFSTNGYENVSLREISKNVGIKVGSIYNHYSSKEAILDDCYNYYITYRHCNRLKKENYEPIIRNGTKEEVINVINYSYPDDIIDNIIMSLLLVFARIYNDTKAMDIYVDEINLSMKFLEEFFRCGIEIGRFHQFNVKTVSLIILSTRLLTAQSVTIKPEQKNDWRNAELDIFNELIKLIPFKY